MTTAFRFTTKDLEAMPEIEGVRYEIIDGELYVSTAPSRDHQHASLVLSSRLFNWTEVSHLGEVLPTPGLIFPGDQNVIPDLIWISDARLAAGLDDAGHLTVAPELVVEVLSPGSSNEFRDREIKFDFYSRIGVDEYWIVDWRARRVEVYRRVGEGLGRVATLTGDDVLTSPLLPGFECKISSLWAPARPGS
ncbi:MAG TPA: Uma2 family endonuclease [Chloroflexota bacterium]|nr:Uma2 family endonuclease [Chloroflexota bacterium]